MTTDNTARDVLVKHLEDAGQYMDAAVLRDGRDEQRPESFPRTRATLAAMEELAALREEEALTNHSFHIKRLTRAQEIFAVAAGLAMDDLKAAAKRIAKLEAALKPFAKEADQWNDTHGVWRCNDDVEIWQTLNIRCSVTVGDLRRARAALDPTHGDGK